MKSNIERKPGSGGARRKATELGIKERATIRIYPSDKELLIKKYGSVQKAFNAFCETERQQKTID